MWIRERGWRCVVRQKIGIKKNFQNLTFPHDSHTNQIASNLVPNDFSHHILAWYAKSAGVCDRIWRAEGRMMMDLIKKCTFGWYPENEERPISKSSVAWTYSSIGTLIWQKWFGGNGDRSDRQKALVLLTKAFKASDHTTWSGDDSQRHAHFWSRPTKFDTLSRLGTFLNDSDQPFWLYPCMAWAQPLCTRVAAILRQWDEAFRSWSLA